FKGEITAKQRGVFGDIVLSRYDLNVSYEPTSFTLIASEKKQLLRIPGISSLRYFANKPGIITVNGEVEGVLFKGVDASYDSGFLDALLVDGRTIDFSDSTAAARQILVSQYTANRLQLKVGDDF